MKNQTKIKRRNIMESLNQISICLLLIFGAFIACESPADITSESTSHEELNAVQSNSSNTPLFAANNTEENVGMATLRRATARYHDVNEAIKDGFVQAMPCQENPEGEGGLGIPFLNPDRLDAIIDPAEPEVLFYEPQKNGRLRLIGVELVIPINLWTENEPPSLFGHEFHRNDEAGLYGLHMWIWKQNPEGIIEFWHSNVSCEHAAD
jgi:hypothetical protein